MMDEPIILDPTGKPTKMERFMPCPRCGASADNRGPSCGFGNPSTICTSCGYEFKELPWQKVTS